MATTRDLTRRIDASLGEIAAEVDFLPELAEDWAAEDEVNRVTWLLEWEELMSRLAGLDEAYHAGTMTTEQRKRYRALRATLRELLPLLARLGLPLPPAPPAE
ncbi:MAG TPA: hypothetical protein VFW96_14180 [Thermomicrobiales bacterium]|nr:hypothetical protein [Thermomicrobiales bacterium]